MPSKDLLILISFNQTRERLRKRKSHIAYNEHLSDSAAIVGKSVEGNIFRVFGSMKEQSTIVYCSWANRIYSHLAASAESVERQADYDALIQDFARQLAL